MIVFNDVLFNITMEQRSVAMEKAACYMIAPCCRWSAGDGGHRSAAGSHECVRALSMAQLAIQPGDRRGNATQQR